MVHKWSFNQLSMNLKTSQANANCQRRHQQIDEVEPFNEY